MHIYLFFFSLCFAIDMKEKCSIYYNHSLNIKTIITLVFLSLQDFLSPAWCYISLAKVFTFCIILIILFQIDFIQDPSVFLS